MADQWKYHISVIVIFYNIIRVKILFQLIMKIVIENGWVYPSVSNICFLRIKWNQTFDESYWFVILSRFRWEVKAGVNSIEWVRTRFKIKFKIHKDLMVEMLALHWAVLVFSFFLCIYNLRPVSELTQRFCYVIIT